MTTEIDLMEILMSEPKETPKPPVKIERKSRHFYRCNDCLSVVVTETKIEEIYNQTKHYKELKATCGACQGRIEYMGATVFTVSGQEFAMKKLVGYKCACDGKCTNAVGPSCDCICGGENHGTGRVVPVYTESGVPVVNVPKEAAQKAEQYRALVVEFKTAYEHKYGRLNQMKRNGEWISNFNDYMDGQYMWGTFIKAKQLRTHGARNKKLSGLIAELKKDGNLRY